MKINALWIHSVLVIALSMQIPVFAAPVLCQTEIEINDVGARVEVDGRTVKGSPVVVTCDIKPRMVTITSSDNQVFTRMIPAAEHFDVRDRTWNVFFRPQETSAFGGVKSAASTVNLDISKIDKTHAQLESARDSQIMRELRVIRSLLENFIKTHPEMHMQAQELASQVVPSGAKAPLVSEGGVISSGLNFGGTQTAPKLGGSQNMAGGSVPPNIGGSGSGGSQSGRVGHFTVLAPPSKMNESNLVAKQSAIGTSRAPNSETIAAAVLPDNSSGSDEISKSSSLKGVESKSANLTIIEDQPFEVKVETNKEVQKAITKAADGRAMSSLAEGPSVGVAEGAYVQLYSLSRKKFDSEEIGRDMAAGYGSELSGASLRFCHWQSKKTLADWTRVLLGPFPSLDMAKEVVKIVGRDTFSVKNPTCDKETAGEVKI